MSAKKKLVKKKYNYPKEDRNTEENPSKEKKKEKKRKTKKNWNNYLEENNIIYNINIKAKKDFEEVNDNIKLCFTRSFRKRI